MSVEQTSLHAGARFQSLEDLEVSIEEWSERNASRLRLEPTLSDSSHSRTWKCISWMLPSSCCKRRDCVFEIEAAKDAELGHWEVVLFTSHHMTEAEWIEWTDRYMHNQTAQQGLIKALHASDNVHMEKVAAPHNQSQQVNVSQVVEGRIVVATSPYIDHNELQAAVEELGKHMQFVVEEGTDGRTDTFSEEGLDPNDIDFRSASFVRTSPQLLDTIYTQGYEVLEVPFAGTEKGSPGTSEVPCPTSSLPRPTTADDTGFFERNEDTRTDLSAPSASTPIAEPAEAESQDTLVLGILQQDKRIVETPSFNLHPSRSSPTSPESGEDIACVDTRTERFTGSSTASSSGFSNGETGPPLAAPSSRSSPSASQAFVQPIDTSSDVISASTSILPSLRLDREHPSIPSTANSRETPVGDPLVSDQQLCIRSSLVPENFGAEVELEQPSPENGHFPITSAHTSRESSLEEPLMSNAQLHRYKLTVSNGPNQRMDLNQVEEQSSPLISATASNFTLQPSQVNLLDSPTSTLTPLPSDNDDDTAAPPAFLEHRDQMTEATGSTKTLPESFDSDDAANDSMDEYLGQWPANPPPRSASRPLRKGRQKSRKNTPHVPRKRRKVSISSQSDSVSSKVEERREKRRIAASADLRIVEGSSSRLLQPAKSGGKFAYPREVKPEEEEDVPIGEKIWAEHAEDSSYDSLSTGEDQSSDVDCPVSSPTSPQIRESSTADSDMHDGDPEIPIRGATTCARHRPQADKANATTNCFASSNQVAHSPLSSDHNQTQMFDPCHWAIVKQEEEEDELQSRSEKSPSPPSAKSRAI